MAHIIKYKCDFETNEFTKCPYKGNDIDPIYVGSTLCHHCEHCLDDDFITSQVTCNHE